MAVPILWRGFYYGQINALSQEFWARAGALVAGLAFGVGAVLVKELLHRIGRPRSVYEEIREMGK